MASETRSAGVSFPMLLGIAFLVLKLCGVISWPWLWVLAPFWVPFALCAVLLLIAGGLALIAKAIDR